MKRFGLFLLAVVLMVGVAGCSSDDDDSNDNPLVGTWTARMGADDPKDPDITVTVTFKDNNTFTTTENGAPSDAGTWSTDGNVLTMNFPEGQETFTYSISGNTLTLTSGGDTIVFTRV